MYNLSAKIEAAQLGQTHLFYLGQAGFIIKSANGKLLGIDLYLSDCVSRFDGFKRLTPIISLDGLVFDCIIATHAHYDHFDIDSMPNLLANGKTRLIASMKCEKEVSQLGINPNIVNYVKPGDKMKLDEIQLEFVYCDHGKFAPDAFGIVVGINNRLIYIAGDTGLRLDKVDDIKNGRSFYAMIAPINGTFGNLNECESAILCEKFNPELFIPCHYGTFAEQYGNVAEFVKIMNSKQLKYYLMRLGEGIVI